MKTELFVDLDLISIHRQLRRNGARIIRCIPRKHRDHRGEVDAWLVLYVGG